MAHGNQPFGLPPHTFISYADTPLNLYMITKHFKNADVLKTDPIDGHNWIEKRPPENLVEKFPEWT